jgi:hypothetical protein
MASTVALMIAAVSSSQIKPDASKSLWPSVTSKKVAGHWQPPDCQAFADNIVPLSGRLSWRPFSLRRWLPNADRKSSSAGRAPHWLAN